MRSRKKRNSCLPWAGAFSNFRRLCEMQYQRAVQARDAYIPLKGDEFDEAAFTEHMPAINLYTGAGSRLPDIRVLLTGPAAAHDAGLLLSSLYSLQYANDEMDALLPLFTQRYRLCRESYNRHLFELVRLHDELNDFVKGKKLNEAAAKWVQGYFRIFADWLRKGAEKSVAVLQDTVIRPLLALNKSNPGSPFIHITTENALQCSSACDTMHTLDNQFRSRLQHYARLYRKALRFLAVMAPHIELPRLREGRQPVFVYAAWLLLLLVPFLLWRLNRPPSPASPPPATATDTLPPAADPKVARLHTAPAVYGIDVSKYQGDLLEQIADFDSIYFVICKATEGLTLRDGTFTANWAKLSRSHVLRGAYHFFISSDDPVKQADFFLRTAVAAGTAEIPLIVDVEAGSLKDSIPADSLQRRLLACLHYIEQQHGRRPILYTNLSFADTYLRNDTFARFPLWLAEYSGKAAPVLPYAWRKTGHTFWQKSESYVIDARITDYDVFNGNGAELLEFVRIDSLRQ